jgi:hypothetical protein
MAVYDTYIYNYQIYSNNLVEGLFAFDNNTKFLNPSVYTLWLNS